MMTVNGFYRVEVRFSSDGQVQIYMFDAKENLLRRWLCPASEIRARPLGRRANGGTEIYFDCQKQELTIVSSCGTVNFPCTAGEGWEMVFGSLLRKEEEEEEEEIFVEVDLDERTVITPRSSR